MNTVPLADEEKPKTQQYFMKKTNKSAKIYFYTCGKAKATKYVLSVKKSFSVFFKKHEPAKNRFSHLWQGKCFLKKT